MIFDILPFWGMAIACYADGTCGKALLVAIIGPLVILIDNELKKKKI